MVLVAVVVLVVVFLRRWAWVWVVRAILSSFTRDAAALKSKPKAVVASAVALD